MSEKKKSQKPRRPRPNHAVQITVWNANGGPVSDAAVRSIEEAVERVTLELFNDGQRLLTQTNIA